MKELEILAKNQEEAVQKAAASLEIDAEHLEVIEEYEPDEIDLKEFAEREGLEAPPSTDEITLYIVRIGFQHYVNEAEEWTNGLISRFWPESSAKAVRFRNIILVRLDVPETSILIGKKGATLDALQHVVVRALLTLDDKFPDVMLDVEGYREKKLLRLEKEAKIATDKALRTGRKIPLSPMSPAERKFIHNMLKDSQDVRTESRGTDRKRHIVVEPLKPASGGYRRGGGGGRGGQNRGAGGGGGKRQGGYQQQGRGGGRQQPPTPKSLDDPNITEQQRQLLYGKMVAERTEDPHMQETTLGDRKALLDEIDRGSASDGSPMVDEIE